MNTSSPTLSGLLPGLSAYLSSERRFSASTVRSYKENILWLVRHFGDVSVSSIDLQFLVTVKSQLVANGAGASRLAGMTYSIKNALIYARDVLGLQVMNVNLIRARGAPRRQVTYLTSDEYNDFVESISLYTCFGRERLSQFCLRALVETLAATGMRISEALALNTESVDFDTGESVIIGKGNKQRTVFFTERALMWIRRYLELRRVRHEALFVGSNGRRLQSTNVQAIFRRIGRELFKRTGKRVTPHILRHTAATNLLERGCPIGHIKEILGHQNLETTCRFYLGQIAKAEVRKAFNTYMSYERSALESNPLGGVDIGRQRAILGP